MGGAIGLPVDQGGLASLRRLAVPINITVLPLSAKCPELSPQEDDNWLSNRISKSSTTAATLGTS
jgi:hypothetical protein